MTNVLLATDADWIRDDVAAALADGDTSISRVHQGRDVRTVVQTNPPDLVVLDLQIGSMGGMATCRDLRHGQESGVLDDVPVLMLLDRDADVFLAQQSTADGWLIKPIDAFRLRRAATELLAGRTHQEGVPSEIAPSADPDDDAGLEGADA